MPRFTPAKRFVTADDLMDSQPILHETSEPIINANKQDSPQAPVIEMLGRQAAKGSTLDPQMRAVLASAGVNFVLNHDALLR